MILFKLPFAFSIFVYFGNFVFLNFDSITNICLFFLSNPKAKPNYPVGLPRRVLINLFGRKGPAPRFSKRFPVFLFSSKFYRATSI